VADVDVVADDIARVAAAVRRLGSDRTIVKNMARDIRRAVPPVRTAVRRNALAYLPHRGGLNRWVAKARVNVKVRRSATDAGVSFAVGRNSAHARTDSRAIDRGKVRAPFFGDRRSWHSQAVRAGFASDAFDDAVPEFRERVVEAVNRAVLEVTRR
jgi:hypothetical protein